ncbi:alpha-tocopherol transfer protein-like [Culicoides brevitarsis]|uniref:alpha-tocopherol transfer protein-like n=1 Tax=Culicoides brevitarsis TaxID=469753 RepID=UPI00307C5BB6
MLKNIAKFDAAAMSQRFASFNQADLVHLRQWLEKTPHLPQLEDHEIFLFLHASNFSVEACKTRLDKFYTIRTRVKAMFEERDVNSDEFRFAHENYACWIMPKPLPDNRKIIISKILNPDRFNFKMILKLMTFVGEYELWTNPSELCDGYIFLVDLKNSRLSHLTQIDFMLNKQMCTYTVDAFPVRISAIHFINAPSHMERIMSIVKTCVSKDITDKFFVHSKPGEIPSCIPREILPRDYEGGQLKSIEELNDDHYNFLYQNREFFIEETKCRRVNERLRSTKNPYDDALFGMQGNFKKLDID